MTNENGVDMNTNQGRKPKQNAQSVIVGFRITQAERDRLEAILKGSDTTITKHFRESVARLLSAHNIREHSS